MTKELPSIAVVCEKITKTTLYALVFLIPLFFLPWSGDVLDFNKQALLVAFTFIPLFAWMLKVLVSGTISLNLNKVNIVGGILFLVYVASTLFSVNKQGSFWGWPSITHESLLTLICLFILYFLVSTTFSEKEVFHSLYLLGASALLVLAHGMLQLFGIYLFPFAFVKTIDFNMIGLGGSLGLYAAVLLPLCMVLSTIAHRWWRIVVWATIALILLTLVINYHFLWWVVLAVSALLVVLWILRKDSFEGKWVSLPMFFLVVSLFFLLINPQVRWLPQRSLEVYPSHATTLGIDMGALKASPVVGSGPGTFGYDFAKYKDAEFNKSPLWSVVFSAGSSKALTDVANVGILGLLATLAFFALPLFYGIVSLLTYKNKGSQPYAVPLVVALVAMIAAQAIGYFLYNSNLSLQFILFFAVGALVALLSQYSSNTMGFGEGRVTYNLKSSSFLNLVVTFVFTSLFIFGLGFLMLEGQRYVADAHYASAVRAFSANQEDEAIRLIKKAVGNNAKIDVYFSQLAFFSVSRLKTEIVQGGAAFTTPEGKKRVEVLVSDAINASTMATQLNPKNFDSWIMKGYVCQNLIGVANDAVDCAIKAYDAAILLNPNNPSLYLEQGNVYMLQASTDTQSRAGAWTKAEDKYRRAIDLKEDYALAYFQMGLLARSQGDAVSQRAAFENATKFSSQDAPLALQLGIVYYQDQNWNLAQAEFQRALGIAPNYTNALYYSGLTYDKQGRISEAIAAFEALARANPNNQSIKRILDNLRAGRPALDGLVPNPPASETPVSPSAR